MHISDDSDLLNELQQHFDFEAAFFPCAGTAEMREGELPGGAAA